MSDITLIEKILNEYPELLNNSDIFRNGTITLMNDSDGFGDYIESWNYEKPIPKGLKLGK